MNTYSESFFGWQMGGSRMAAQRIAPICVELLQPESVVDVGCGVGAWAAEFARQGVAEISGLDGDYLNRDMLQIPVESFTPTDLEQPIVAPRRYSLAVSLEVAEHLTPERARSFVADLTRLAPAVLFSAAIPYQGGTHHINEQWQDFWADLFAERGYRPVDCVRPAVWNDTTICPWYAQNTLLYVSPEVDLELPDSSMPLRVVHPGFYALSKDQSQTLAALSRDLRCAIRRAGKRKVQAVRQWMPSRQS